MRRGPKLSAIAVWVLFIWSRLTSRKGGQELNSAPTLCWVCFIKSAKVNCRLQAHSQSTAPKKDKTKLPIDTPYKLPAPLPTWPAGRDFATGKINLGSLEVYQITSLKEVWTIYNHGPDNLGATFYEPTSIPQDFFMLGCYSQPNNQPLYGSVLVARDISSPDEPAGLELPTDYTLVWSTESYLVTQDAIGYVWLPVARDGFKAVGHVVTTSPEKPPLDKVRVVRTELTESIETDTWIWGAFGFDFYSSRPVFRGSDAVGVPTGTFITVKNGTTLSLYCLVNYNLTFPGMPNILQLEAAIQAYAPVVYFHPDEKYFPSSVNWFFENGALLYKNGQESNPVPIDEDGKNLPQDGSNDGAYWIDLPTDEDARDKVKKGNLQSALAYLHTKPALGGTFTDIVVWIFYPFNGPGAIRFLFFTISLGEIGEHVADWEHVTLRVSNFDGELKSVYYSQHDKGTWVSAPHLEYENNNKPIVYASKYGHASYPKAGMNVHSAPLQDKILVGAQNDTSKSDVKLDTGEEYWFLSAEYTGGWPEGSQYPTPWLDYAREWGPKRPLDLGKLLRMVESVIPDKFRRDFDDFVRNHLPAEALGEEGPIGPKWKDNWSGDERD